VLQTNVVLDPEVLLREMHAVADMLVQGFINLGGKTELEGDVGGGDTNATAAERARRRAGTRVVPVRRHPRGAMPSRSLHGTGC
jgi:hypothetical protein